MHTFKTKKTRRESTIPPVKQLSERCAATTSLHHKVQRRSHALHNATLLWHPAMSTCKQVTLTNIAGITGEVQIVPEQILVLFPAGTSLRSGLETDRKRILRFRPKMKTGRKWHFIFGPKPKRKLLRIFGRKRKRNSVVQVITCDKVMYFYVNTQMMQHKFKITKILDTKATAVKANINCS